MTLGAIANEGKGIVFEILLELGQGPVATLVDDLLGSSKIESLDASGTLLQDELATSETAKGTNTNSRLGGFGRSTS